MINFVCTVHPIAQESRYGCHGNHACFHSAIEFIFEDDFFCISGVPGNDLATMKNCPGGASN